MRKFTKVLAVIFLLAAFAGADDDQLFTSLNAVSATGAGNAVRSVGGTGERNFTWVTFFTGTPTAINVNLEGSVDGTHYYTLDSSTSTSGEMRHIAYKSVRFVRCNISSYTVNGSTASCRIFGVS
jgi:hypothetical protein